MNQPEPIAGPELHSLCALFPPADYLAVHELIPPEHVPPPYHGLLVHEHHMTVTVEAYHGGLVDVRVLDRRLVDDVYARKILLTLQRTGEVVQLGIARVRLRFTSDAVRAEILAARTPLGRILIEHDVLRRVEPTAYLRVVTGLAMMDWFTLAQPTVTYGRLAIIYCDGQPAIEVLEIVRPES
jgi:chorismate-pyruvate lyase